MVLQSSHSSGCSYTALVLYLSRVIVVVLQSNSLACVCACVCYPVYNILVLNTFPTWTGDIIADFSQYIFDSIYKTAASSQQIADSRQQTADSRQQTADHTHSRQQTADSRQQTADGRQQTADSRQQTADSRQEKLYLRSSPAGCTTAHRLPVCVCVCVCVCTSVLVCGCVCVCVCVHQVSSDVVDLQHPLRQEAVGPARESLSWCMVYRVRV
jgi:cobalamin biosynthesis Mg chelatase CobN